LIAAFGALPQAQTPGGDLFDPSVIHDVRVQLNSRDLEELRARYLENRFYPADLIWGGTRVRNVAIRSRGGGSRNPVKPGLLVEFDHYVTGQRFGGRRALVLDNLWQDPSMIRERVAMALFTRMGQPASLESFVRLYINGEYHGLYAAVENVDEDFLARAFADPAGGLHEFHWLRPYYFEDLGDDLAAYPPFFEPRSNEGGAPAVLFQPIRDMLRAVNEPSETLWRIGAEAHVDLPQLLTHVAIGAFMSEWDGILGYAGVNNFYLYRPSDRTQHQAIPWDRDNAFHDDDPSIFRRVDENVLVRRALTYPDLYKHYLDVLEQTARAAADGRWLDSEIRAAATLVTPEAAADPRAPYPFATHQEEIGFLLDFAARRPQRVLEEVAQARRADSRQ
jgi:spore coat protein CotH